MHNLCTLSQSLPKEAMGSVFEDCQNVTVQGSNEPELSLKLALLGAAGWT